MEPIEAQLCQSSVEERYSPFPMTSLEIHTVGYDSEVLCSPPFPVTSLEIHTVGHDSEVLCSPPHQAGHESSPYGMVCIAFVRSLNMHNKPKDGDYAE